MKPVRLSRMLLVGMVVLLTLVPPGAAWAKPPDQYTYHLEFDAPWIDCGDFMVNEQTAIDVRVREHYDKEGNWVRAVEHYDWNGIVYNDQYPEFFLVEKPTHFSITYDPDGFETWVGLFINIHVPGQGPVLQGAGREVVYWLDDGYELVFYAGQSGYIDGNFDALCAALSP